MQCHLQLMACLVVRDIVFLQVVLVLFVKKKKKSSILL